MPRVVSCISNADCTLSTNWQVDSKLSSGRAFQEVVGALRQEALGGSLEWELAGVNPHDGEICKLRESNQPLANFNGIASTLGVCL